MQHRRLCLFALCGSLFVSAAVIAHSEPLRDRLSAEEFNKAGLNKLSAEELAYLETLLEGKRGNDEATTSSPRQQSREPAVTGERAFGAEQKPRKRQEPPDIPNEITSRLVGDFNGWTGSTEFTLENGQRWRQVESGTLVAKLKNPKVVIRKGALGAYFFGVEGYNSRVKVRRIE